MLESRGRDEKGKMTAIAYTIYEQPISPVPKNPTSDKPILEKPKADNPTSENPMQLNKDIQKTDLSRKEEINKDGLNTDSIPILSPDPSPLSEQDPFPEKKGKEQKDAYKIYKEIIKDNIEYEYLINARTLFILSFCYGICKLLSDLMDFFKADLSRLKGLYQVMS